MHKILKLPLMQLRNQVLNATYFARLSNSTDRSIPAVRLFAARKLLPSPGQIRETSTETVLEKHSLVSNSQLQPRLASIRIETRI